MISAGKNRYVCIVSLEYIAAHLNMIPVVAFFHVETWYVCRKSTQVISIILKVSATSFRGKKSTQVRSFSIFRYVFSF